MKKMRIFFWALLLCFLALSISAAPIYVANGASGTGASATDAVGSLTGAVAKLPNGGEITICGSYAVTESETLPETDGDITITGGRLELSGTLAFAKNENDNVYTLDLAVTSDGGRIFGGFNSITFGENFEVTGSVDFYGGVEAAVGTNNAPDTNRPLNLACITELPYTLTVKNGVFGRFYGGNLRPAGKTMDSLTGSIAASLTVCVEGGSFTEKFSLSGDSILADNAALTVVGGDFSCPIYVQGNKGGGGSKTSYNSIVTLSDPMYYAADGETVIDLLGGSFSGGIISAHEMTEEVTPAQLLRGNFTLNIGESAVFTAPTTLDATQVKGYAGRDTIAVLTCPDASAFTVSRFDSVNGEAQLYEEPLRILFVGDSITQGTGSSYETTKSYSAIFRALAVADDRDVVIGNYGVGSSQVLDFTYLSYRGTLAHVLAYNETDPDYVVIALGTNDAERIGGTSGRMLQFLAQYEDLVRMYGELPSTQKVFATTALYRLTSNKAADVRAISVTRPCQIEVLDKLAAEDADKYVLVDLYSLLLDEATDDSLFANDKLHPNDAGYVLYAKAVYDAVFQGVTAGKIEMNDLYLSAKGRLNGAGTEADPLSSLTVAFGKIADGGTIHVMGEYSYAGRIVTPRGKTFSIVGEGEGVKFTFNGDTFRCLGNVTLDNLYMTSSSGTYWYLVGCFNDLTLGEGFDTSSNCRLILGGLLFYGDPGKSAWDSYESACADRDCTLTILGGHYYQFLGGNLRLSSDSPFGLYSGNRTITIGEKVVISANGANGIGGQNYASGHTTAYIHSWPTGQLVRDYARLGTLADTIVFDESNNTGTIEYHFGAKAVNPIPIITGDLNGDGAVNLADALQLLRSQVNGLGGKELHTFYSQTEIKLVNVLRAIRKLAQ